MASEVRKHADYIPNAISSNEEEQYLFQFTLETNFSEIEKEFEKLNISLLVEQYSGRFVAKYDTFNAQWKQKIAQVLYRFSSGYKAVKKVLQRGCFVTQDRVSDFKIYNTNVDNVVWVVGKKDMIDDANLDINDPRWNSKAQSSNSNFGNNNPGREINVPVEIPLTQEEQASIYLNRMWDVQCIPGPGIDLKMYKFYNAKVFVQPESSTDLSNKEKYIKDKIRANLLKLFKSEVNLKPGEIVLLSSDSVHEYVEREINRSETNIRCAWYIDENQNTVSLYAKVELDISCAERSLKNSFCSGSCQVPDKCLSSVELKNKIKDLISRYNNKLNIWLDSLNNTLCYICLKDKEFEFKRELTTLFLTKSVDIKDKNKQYVCKRIFQSVKEDVEEKYNVNVTEEQKYDWKYGWVVKGMSQVEAACEKLITVVNTIYTQVNYYQSNESYETMQLNLIAVNDRNIDSIASIEMVMSSQVSGLNDLRDDVLCSRWVLPNGIVIKLINADYSWLLKSSKLLQIFDDSEKQNPSKLPDNGENSDTTRETIRSKLDKYFQGKVSAASISFLLKSLESLGWPLEMFIKELFASLQRHSIQVPFCILEPSRHTFEKASSIIQSFSATVCQPSRIRIQVKTGELAKERCDVIVNSTHERLLLSNGKVSSSILAAAGQHIQDECNAYLKHKSKITSTEVVVTKGYSLQCKKVFHGALADWKEQTLEKFVHNCLKEAETRGLSSIAFPSLGTGNLGYPVAYVAKTMFETVKKFAQQSNIGNLKEVYFVIYEKDTKALKAFQEEATRQNRAVASKEEERIKCPDSYFYRVTVTGKNEECVKRTFHMIEIGSKSKQMGTTLDEPGKQEITRYDQPSSTSQNASLDDEEEVFMNDIKAWLAKDNPVVKPGNGTLALNTSKKQEKVTPIKEKEDFTVSFQLLDESMIEPYNFFVETFAKYDLDKSRIIWCPCSSREARIKFTNESDADNIISRMKSETKVTVTKCSMDAVVNIKAKLNGAMNVYLQSEESREILKGSSGVNISDDNTGSITLTGNLHDIGTARSMLLNWSENSKTYFSVTYSQLESTGMNASKSHTTLHPNAMNNPETEGTENKRKIPDIPRTSTDDTLDEKSRGNKLYPDIDNEKACLASAITIDKETNRALNVTDEESLMMTTKEGIKVYVYKGNLCFLNVDCIVNSSNEEMKHTSGLAAVIAQKAGNLMEDECRKYLKQFEFLSQSDVCVTKAGNLDRYSYIFHVCSPIWAARNSTDEFITSLSNVITQALKKASELKMKSIGIPAIGSGRRGGPKEMCYSTYPIGVREFSKRFGGNTSLKEIHFVDIAEHITTLVQAAFLSSVTQPDHSELKKLKKIPVMIKLNFDPNAGVDDDECHFLQYKFENNINVIVCDGALSTAHNHRHNLTEDISFEDNGVVMTEDVAFTGKSRSASLGLHRGGKDFHRNYDTLRNEKKKKPGKVYHALGDRSLKFGNVFFPITASCTEKAFDQGSGESSKLLENINICCRSILKEADKWKVRHLCLPFIVEDCYPCKVKWFLEKSASNMLEEIEMYASKRKNKEVLVIHMPINKNESTMNLFSRILKNREKPSVGCRQEKNEVLQKESVV